MHQRKKKRRLRIEDVCMSRLEYVISLSHTILSIVPSLVSCNMFRIFRYRHQFFPPKMIVQLDKQRVLYILLLCCFSKEMSHIMIVTTVWWAIYSLHLDTNPKQSQILVDEWPHKFIGATPFAFSNVGKKNCSNLLHLIRAYGILNSIEDVSLTYQ